MPSEDPLKPQPHIQGKSDTGWHEGIIILTAHGTDLELINKHEQKLADKFKYLEDVALFNQEKVLNSFKKNHLALRHFVGTTGYGYGDEGRDMLNVVFADIFKAEKAICSPNIVSGTHALSLCLVGVLRPGDRLVSVTGNPYDTLKGVISSKGTGSLADFGVDYQMIDLLADGSFDYGSIDAALKENQNISQFCL